MKKMKVELTLIEGMLGTKAGNPELLRDYIANKHPEAVQDDELNTMPDIEEEVQHGTTFFNRTEEGVPFIFDYQIKGFFKDAQGMLNRVEGAKLSAHKKVIDGLVFIDERQIELIIPEGEEITICERPLRAQTPQGERVSIARSEEVPAGTKIRFTITVLEDKLMSHVIEWLNYGSLRGIGQWRNSGKGKFTWDDIATE